MILSLYQQIKGGGNSVNTAKIKMKNLKVNQFETKVSEILANQKNSILAQFTKHIATINTIDFAVFSNENQYTGELNNNIFYTYSNCYHANSPLHMSVGNLHHPHSSFEDRGYIKGVATDLSGYIALRACKLVTNMDIVTGIYFPRFKKSAHSNEYVAACRLIADKAIAELNDFVKLQEDILNSELKKLTGCSLLYYIQTI